MTDFLFHEVSDKEKEEIKEEAKNIMDSFSKKLAKVDKKISESLIEMDDFEREEVGLPTTSSKLGQSREGNSGELDGDFRKRMFDNAQNKNDSFIVAEKKSW